VVDDDLSMTVILNALQEQTNANILSTPSLLTLDNEEAFLTVGQQVPFITGSFTNTGGNDGAQNPFQTIERQSVGITLTVTPQINEGDSVVLDIEQEVNSLTGVSLASAAAADLITNERRDRDQGACRGWTCRGPRGPDQGRRAVNRNSACRCSVIFHSSAGCFATKGSPSPRPTC
jgi:hypothetical protein